MRVIPARMGNMIADVDEVNDYIVKGALDRLDGISSINDAGNQDGDKYTYKAVVGYDHSDDSILEVVLGCRCSSGRLAGGWQAICDSVIVDVVRIGITVPFIGSASDNASYVINAFVSHMQVINMMHLFF